MRFDTAVLLGPTGQRRPGANGSRLLGVVARASLSTRRGGADVPPPEFRMQMSKVASEAMASIMAVDAKLVLFRTFCAAFGWPLSLVVTWGKQTGPVVGAGSGAVAGYPGRGAAMLVVAAGLGEPPVRWCSRSR